jgi:cyclin D1/2/4, plant|uniref:Uncharacterized protein n=1 Tax=Zea mays TaxID=4577 RepID=C0P569_MAIZE|nr:unknown [Zea mays]
MKADERRLVVVDCTALQVEGTSRYDCFEPGTVGQMELLVLMALNWRLRSVTPFTFVDFFACKVDPGGRHTRCLIARATQVILAAMHGNIIMHCLCLGLGAAGVNLVLRCSACSSNLQCTNCGTATDVEFLDHCPSSMAAAAVLCAIGETPSLESVSPGAAVSWCIGLAEVYTPHKNY